MMKNKDYTKIIQSTIDELTDIKEVLTKTIIDIEANKCPPIYGDPPKGLACIKPFDFKTLDEAMQGFAEWIHKAGDRMSPPK